MKRFLGLFLSFVLIFTLAACGSEPEATVPAATQEPTLEIIQETEAPAPTAEATEEATEAISDYVDSSEEEEEIPTEPLSYTTEAEELVNNENLVFAITGYKENEHLGLEMHVTCENKSDKNMMFSLDNVSVCGLMFDPLWAEEIAAGKKVNSIVYFDTYALSEMGVASLDEISFRLNVIDNDEWMNEPFAADTFTVYPTGLAADSVSYPNYRHKNGETVVLDNDQLLFIVEKVDDTDSDIYTLNCYIANRTSQDLLIGWDMVSVNDSMVDPFWASGVSAGKQLYTRINFFRSDLEAQGIENVTEIGFTLSAIDYDSYDTILEETCSFQPK